MPHELGILDLLAVYGFDPHWKAKLVRHQDSRYDVPTLIRDGWFELYQGLQRRPVFHGCDYIVAFTGDGGTRARFLGVYRLLKQRDSSEVKIPNDCPYPEWGQKSKFFYELERQEQFADLEGRLIIEWGAGALAWRDGCGRARQGDGTALLPVSRQGGWGVLPVRSGARCQSAPGASRDGGVHAGPQANAVDRGGREGGLGLFAAEWKIEPGGEEFRRLLAHFEEVVAFVEVHGRLSGGGEVPGVP